MAYVVIWRDGENNDHFQYFWEKEAVALYLKEHDLMDSNHATVLIVEDKYPASLFTKIMHLSQFR